MQQMQQAMFQKADTDADGSLTLDEFTAVGPEKNAGEASSAEKAKAQKVFKSIDTDGDGNASETEMSAFMSKLSSQTQSSVISLQQQFGGQDPMMDLLDKADADGDGALSLDEFTSAKPDDVSSDQSNEMFGEMDSDGDGKVTQDEMKTFAESHRPDQSASAGQMPPPPPSANGSSGTQGSSLADILAQASASSDSSESDSVSSLADILNQASSSDDTETSATDDFSKQLSSLLQQLVSGYANQAKGSASTMSVSA
jgi:Ca2+-binding EF-hand superfamily protein